eukprot:7047296-Lingulodinium_polyedra.AAC.1
MPDPRNGRGHRSGTANMAMMPPVVATPPLPTRRPPPHPVATIVARETEGGPSETYPRANAALR